MCSGEDYITRSLMICSTYVGEERYIQDFGGEILGKEILARPRVEGSVILKWIFKKWNGAWAGSIWLR